MNDNTTAILVFAVLAVVALAGGLWSWHRHRVRRQGLIDWAAANGFEFLDVREHQDGLPCERFRVLDRGDNRYAYHLMRGWRGGFEVMAFDYHYETTTTSDGKRRTNHHYFSAVAVSSPLPLKPLFIRPEGFFDRVAAAIGIDDIDFELDEFSRTFHVTSPDKRFAFDVLHQATIELLLAAPRFAWEFGGRQVICSRDKLFDPVDFEAALATTLGMLDRLPEYLKRELKGTIE